MSQLDHSELQAMVIRLHDIGRDTQIIAFRVIADTQIIAFRVIADTQIIAFRVIADRLSDLAEYLRSHTGHVLNSTQNVMDTINRPVED